MESSRRYPSLERLTLEIVDDPDFFGLFVYRQNPCCYKDQPEVALHPNVASEHYANAEDAATHLRALADAIDILLARFAETGDIPTESFPCVGCWDTGNVDPKWLADNPDLPEEYVA